MLRTLFFTFPPAAAALAPDGSTATDAMGVAVNFPASPQRITVIDPLKFDFTLPVAQQVAALLF